MKKTLPTIAGFEDARVESQIMQAVSGNWKRQENRFFPNSPKKKKNKTKKPHIPANTLILARGEPFLTSDHQRYEK